MASSDRVISVGKGAADLPSSEVSDESWRTAVVEQTLRDARTEEANDPEWADFGEEDEESGSTAGWATLGVRVRALFYDVEEATTAVTEEKEEEEEETAGACVQREFASCTACWEHARAQHGLDMITWQTTLGLDLYDSIRLVNHIRATVRARRCFVCDGVSSGTLAATYSSQTSLCAHLREKKHCAAPEHFRPLLTALRSCDEVG
jgi:C2H2 type zinc-finger (2 copies)